MEAILITTENIEELKEEFEFENFIHEGDDPDIGKFVEYTEDEAAESIGKYLVKDWPAFARGFGIVSAEVFEAEFTATIHWTELLDVRLDKWFTVTKNEVS